LGVGSVNSNVRRVKLDPVLADRVLDAVRQQLPDGVKVSRRGRSKLRIKSKPAKYEWAFSSSPAFSHISRRNTAAGAVAIAMTSTLRAVTDHLKQHDRRWPGLEWGPTEVEADVEGDVVIGKVTDHVGNSVLIPPVQTA
jgi:hypothetical protein